MLGLGILGGTLPLATYVIIEHSSTKLSEQVLDGNRFAKQVSMSGVPLGADFTEASANTINSVVHITTKVVSTTFQRDPFQELFMVQVLVEENSNNMAQVRVRVSSFLRKDTLSQIIT